MSLTTFMAAALLSTTPAAAPEILFQGDLEGELARPRCAQGGRELADFAELVDRLARAREAAREQGEPAPITLLAGDPLAPDPFVASMLEADPAGGMDAAVELLGRADYDAITLGPSTLALGVEPLGRFARAAAKAGMPIVLSNLAGCDARAQPLCAFLKPEIIVERGEHRIGVVAALSPRALRAVPPQALTGLRFEEPAAGARRALQRLRASGATRSVLMAHVPTEGGLDELGALLLELDADAPDLVLVSGLGEAGGKRALRALSLDGGPPVVGALRGAAGARRIRFGSGASEAEVVALAAGEGSADAGTRARLAPHAQAFCRRYGGALAALNRPMEREAFAAYVLEAMRRITGAEISVFALPALRARAFPLEGAVTRADVRRALPGQERLGVAAISGEGLAPLLAVLASNPRLSQLGVGAPGPGLPSAAVNGRPIDPTRRYGLATTDAVARGVHGALGPQPLPLRPAAGSPSLAEAVEGLLEALASGGRPPALDGAADFGEPLSRRALVTWTADLQGDFQDVSTSNTDKYGGVNLPASQQRAVRAELVSVLRVSHPAHESETRLRLRYAWGSQSAAGLPTISGKVEDAIGLSSLYLYRGLAPPGPERGSLVPAPYTRLYVESEFTRPDRNMMFVRQFHHLGFIHSAGALWTVAPRVKARLGAGYSKELTADSRSADPWEAALGRWRCGFEAGVALEPILLSPRVPVRLEAEAEYLFLDPSLPQHQLSAHAGLAVPLAPPLFFTASLDAFAVNLRGQGWSRATRTLLGLRVHLDAAYQAH